MSQLLENLMHGKLAMTEKYIDNTQQNEINEEDNQEKPTEVLDDIQESDNISKVVDIIKKEGNMMSLRTPLEGVFKKKDIDFVMSPVAHFRIKDNGKTLIIVNKKYADKAEATEGELAVGYEGKI